MKTYIALSLACIVVVSLGLVVLPLLAADQGMTTTGPAATTAPAVKVVNDRCPITGNKIDPDKVPANLTRDFEGQKVGFCCGNCPGAWDKLSTDEKKAKLAKVMVQKVIPGMP